MLPWLLLACRRDPDPEPTGPSGTPPTAGRWRNLVVVSLDTTRRDHLAPFAGGPATTPFLDARLAEGLVLADHRSCSNWTAPSMFCAQTGRSPLELGVWPGTGDPEVPGFPRALPTVARLWSAAGGRSRLVTGNAVFSSALAADGFDREVVLDYAGAGAVADAALAEADVLAGEVPGYLHVHFMDPHRPLCPPEALAPDFSGIPEVGFDVCEELDLALDTWDDRDAAWRDALLARVDLAYRAELRAFDQSLERLWTDLDDRGLLDDALVVFHTDHGEQHHERGVIDHGFALHAEENRAAAGFWARDLAPGRIDAPTLHEDLAASVFEAFGLAPATPPSGLPVWGELPADRVRRLFAYSAADHGPPQLGIVAGDRVRLADWSGEGSYHATDTDPAERVEAPDDPQRPALEAELRAFADEVAARWPHLGPPGFDAP